MRKVLGICGYATCGKDTFALPLIAKGMARVALADQLKLEVARHMGVTCERLEAEKSLWRPLLVAYGAGKRRVDPDHWINQAAATMPGGDLLFTDIRYANEAKWIWELGGYLVRIVRPCIEAANEEERISINKVDELATHRTYWISNNGSIEDLHLKAMSVWQNFP